MREVLTVSIGNAGNSIANSFWKFLCFEHAIKYKYGILEDNYTKIQLDGAEAFFEQTDLGRFYAREISIDTDIFKESREESCLYKSEYIIRGKESAANNYAAGRFTEGELIYQPSIEAIRIATEKCEALQSFQMVHSIGGGTGSGFASLLLCSLEEDYCDNLFANYVIIPSPNTSETIVEPYNVILSLPTLTEFSHLTFCFDNAALSDICGRRTHNFTDFGHMNHIIASTMSGITSAMRFPGQLNSGFRKIFVNMVPFPSLHYMVTSFAPLETCPFEKEIPVYDLVKKMISPSNLLCCIDLTAGKMITATGIFRGVRSTQKIEEAFSQVRKENCEIFVDWIPNNTKVVFCDIPPRGFHSTGTLLANTSAINCVWKRVLGQTSALLQKKAYLHWYLCEGLEEQEFHDAMECVQQLIDDYESVNKEGKSSEKSNKSGNRECCCRNICFKKKDNYDCENDDDTDYCNTNTENRRDLSFAACICKRKKNTDEDSAKKSCSCKRNISTGCDSEDNQPKKKPLICGKCVCSRARYK